MTESSVDLQMAFLRGLGYTGSLADMERAYYSASSDTGLTYDGDTLTSGEPFAEPEGGTGFVVGAVGGVPMIFSQTIGSTPEEEGVSRVVSLDTFGGLNIGSLVPGEDGGGGENQVRLSSNEGLLASTQEVTPEGSTSNMATLTTNGIYLYDNLKQGPLPDTEVISGTIFGVSPYGVLVSVVSSSGSPDINVNFEWTDVQLKSETPQILVLAASDPVPVDTPAGTIIMRTP